MIRLVLACAPGDEAEEIARAAVLEVFADGIEERRGAPAGSSSRSTARIAPHGCPDVAGHVERGAGRRRLGGRLARVPHGPHGQGQALGRTALGDAAGRASRPS